VLDSLRFMLESCDERQLFSFSDGERFLARSICTSPPASS
jgi:two-component system response regulator TtrR